MKITPRDYQMRDIQSLRECFRSESAGGNGNRAVLYQLSTGGGKTAVAAFVVEGAGKRKLRVLFLVHRAELTRQASRTFNDMGLEHGIIATGFTPDFSVNVQVGMVQTVARRLGKIPAPDLIIQDECHHLRAKTFSSIIDFYPKAKILGLSATPIRLDKQGLGVKCGGHFDSMVSSIPLSELMAQGYLVRPIIYAPPIGAEFSSNKKKFGDFNQTEDTAALDKPVVTGCAIEHYRKICDGAKAIIFCSSVKHAENTADRFNQAGYRAASLDGTMHDNERKGRVEEIASGRIHALTSVDLVSEGFDLPSLQVAIMLRRSASLSMILQMIGRVLRPEYATGYDLSTVKGRLDAIAASAKPNAYIIDHVGNIRLHELEGLGTPEFDIEWTLDGEVKRKQKPGEAARQYRQCSQCYRVHLPAPKCPFCGFEHVAKGRELEQVEGSLEVVSPTDPAIVKRLEQIEKDRARFARMREEQMCKTLDDWKELGKRRGYSPAWPHIRFKQKQDRHAATLPGVR
jgi:DNA repair protein RadD